MFAMGTLAFASVKLLGISKMEEPATNSSSLSSGGIADDSGANRAETKSDNVASDWPNPTPLISSIAAACFVASLLYVSGLGMGLQQNLFGYFDITDFLRITPAWAIPVLGFFLLNELHSTVRGSRPEEPYLTKSDKPSGKTLLESIVRSFLDPLESLPSVMGFFFGNRNPPR